MKPKKVVYTPDPVTRKEFAKRHNIDVVTVGRKIADGTIVELVNTLSSVSQIDWKVYGAMVFRKFSKKISESERADITSEINNKVRKQLRAESNEAHGKKKYARYK